LSSAVIEKTYGGRRSMREKCVSRGGYMQVFLA
jgi:hypothetical protein